ncbi:MAG: hypothetical protein RR332_02045 [Clostridiales bacterium]
MQLILLSSSFYNEYGHLSEILKKDSRSYSCIGIEHGGLLFAIPFCHHIKHKFAFSTFDESGLDYTKSVIILDKKYIDEAAPIIDQREFNMRKGKETQITNSLRRYIKIYKEAKNRLDIPRNKQLIQCSTLQYFEKYL